MEIYHRKINVFDDDNKYIDYYYFVIKDRECDVLTISFRGDEFFLISINRLFHLMKDIEKIDIFEFIFLKNNFKKFFNQEIEDSINSLEILQIYEDVKKELEELL